MPKITITVAIDNGKSGSNWEQTYETNVSPVEIGRAVSRLVETEVFRTNLEAKPLQPKGTWSMS